MLRYLAVLLLASLAQSAAAQENYPSRQITLRRRSKKSSSLQCQAPAPN